VLQVEVHEDGKAHNIRIVRSLGLGLDEKAVQAVEQWKFVPGRKEGKSVKVAATIEVNFRLL
jgi:TonB family protein